MASTPFSLEGLLLYMTETFTAGVIQSYQGQGMLENAPLLPHQDPLEDFKKFDQNDEIFQEYDPPLGDESKMGWKKNSTAKMVDVALEGSKTRIFNTDLWRCVAWFSGYFDIDSGL